METAPFDRSAETCARIHFALSAHAQISTMNVIEGLGIPELVLIAYAVSCVPIEE